MNTGWLGKRFARLYRLTSLRFRLTALVLASAIPILIGATVLINNQAAAYVEQNSTAQLNAANRMLAATSSVWTDAQLRALQNLVSLPDIASMRADRQKPLLQKMSAAYPYMYLVSTTDLKGLNVARNDDVPLKDYSDRGWFQMARAGAPVTFESLLDKTSNKPALVVSMPITNAAGQIVGVGMFATELENLASQVQAARVGKTGFAYLVDRQNQVLAHPDSAYMGSLHDLSAYPPVAALRQGKRGQMSFVDETGQRWRASVDELDNGWGVVIQQQEAELLGAQRLFLQIDLAVLVGAILLLTSANWWAVRRVLQPISELTSAATAVMSGDLFAQARVESQDELGTLATAFNRMTARLRQTLQDLELRVTERTRALEASAQISRRLSTLLDENQIVAEVVEQLRAAYNYDHVHIYLFDAARNYLVLASGTGEVGAALRARGHRLARGQGLVGRAAETNTVVLASDVNQTPGWLPNPLLPDTQSEVAVPIALGGQALGVLDVQQNVLGGLKPADGELIQAAAQQTAIVLQNARSFAKAQRKAQAEALIRHITQEIQSTTTAPAALQVAVRELGQALGAERARVRLGAAEPVTGTAGRPHTS